MTAITLPGQLELPTVIDHKPQIHGSSEEWRTASREYEIARLLRSYEERPTSETWARIQSLAAEILR